jgi:hypothetical protein
MNFLVAPRIAFTPSEQRSGLSSIEPDESMALWVRHDQYEVPFERNRPIGDVACRFPSVQERS